MSLLFLIAAAGADGAVSLPREAAEPVGNYLACLYDPVERVLTSGLPEEKARRSAIVEQELTRCHPTRISTATEIDQRLSSLADRKDSSARKKRIEAVLSAMDRQYRFIVVEREKFIKLSHAYEVCVEEKGMDKC